MFEWLYQPAYNLSYQNIFKYTFNEKFRTKLFNLKYTLNICLNKKCFLINDS